MDSNPGSYFPNRMVFPDHASMEERAAYFEHLRLGIGRKTVLSDGSQPNFNFSSLNRTLLTNALASQSEFEKAGNYLYRNSIINDAENLKVDITAEQKHDMLEMAAESSDVRSVSLSSEHVMSHAGLSLPSSNSERAFKCHICPASYTEAHHLENHLRTHADNKPHKCPECDKKFKLPSLLKRHMLVHNKDAQKCQYCNRYFANWSKIEKHLTTDHNMQPSHLCIVCGKAFVLESNLQMHVSMHNYMESVGNDSAKLQCDQCDKVVYEDEALRNHKLTEHFQKESASYPDISTPASLESYKSTSLVFPSSQACFQYDNDSLKCPKCSKHFSQFETLKYHLQTCTIDAHPNHLEENIKCPNCTQSFPHVDVLKYHLKTCCVGVHTCKICQAMFTEAKLLESHMHLHAVQVQKNVSPVVSNIPPDAEAINSSNSKSTLSINSSILFPEKKHGCEQCGSTFATSYGLKRHRLMHSNEKPHICQACGKSFKHAFHLKDHTLKHLKNQLKAAQKECHDSGHDRKVSLPSITSGVLSIPHSSASMLTSSISSINMTRENMEAISAHSLKQLQGIPSSNVQAMMPETSSVKTNEYLKNSNKQVVTTNTVANSVNSVVSVEHAKRIQSILEKLERTEEAKTFPEVPHGCRSCGKVFTTSYGLKRHMITHTGEKRHSCETCGQKFAHSYHLKDHIKIHTGNRQHVCTLCEKKFTVRHALKRHMLTHSGEKPHKCLYCNKQFTTASNLKKHLFVHLKTFPDTCASNLLA